MSMTAHLVAMKSKEELFLGKVLRNPDDSYRAFSYAGVEDHILHNAIIGFLVDHVKDDVRLMTDDEFYDLDLSGYLIRNTDYGLPFRGPKDLGTG